MSFQDGSYLAEFLLEKGYEVHGILRRSSSFNTGRIQHLYGQPTCHTGGLMKLHYGDLTDTTCLISIITKVSVNLETRRGDRRSLLFFMK